MKNNQGFSNILLIVVFLVLFGVAGFFGYNYFITSNSLPNDMPELPGNDQLTNDDSNKDEPSKIVESVKQEIESNNLSRIESITSENGTVWWITEDDYNVLTVNDSSFMVKFDKRSKISYPETADFDEINLIVKNKLLSQGFEFNELNSNTGFERAGNKDYIDFIQAYEKPGIKCVGKGSYDTPYFETSNSIITEYIFSCTTEEKINQNYHALKPFTHAYVNAHQEADRKTFVLHNLIIRDEKAFATIRDRRGASSISFYKEGDTWKYWHSMQAVPFCADLIKRGVPKKFQEGCNDEKY